MSNRSNLDSVRAYSALSLLQTYDLRFNYLKIHAQPIGIATFGDDRYINQRFYSSEEWKAVRNKVITRDKGRDLGIQDSRYEIQGMIYVHHMNPITVRDILERPEYCLDPEFLICCSENTHKAIHYGSIDTVLPPMFGRTPNDTCPWLS